MGEDSGEDYLYRMRIYVGARHVWHLLKLYPKPFELLIDSFHWTLTKTFDQLAAFTP